MSELEMTLAKPDKERQRDVETTDARRTKGRTKVVFFRLSPQEYDAVRRAAEMAGSPSVSSFTRFVLLFWLESHQGQKDIPTTDIERLRAKFSDFEQMFRHFVRKQAEGDEHG